MVHTIEAHNSAGSVRASATLHPFDTPPTLGTLDDTPYGPFSLSQFIALVIGCSILAVAIVVMVCVLPGMITRRRRLKVPTAFVNEFLTEDFAEEIQQVVSQRGIPPSCCLIELGIPC